MKKLLFLILSFILSANICLATTINNAGFIPGPLWFSKYPIFSEESVRIYTTVYNNSEYDLEGSVFFQINGHEIDSVNFSLAKGVGSRDVWVDWVAQKGNAEISAIIKNLKASNTEIEFSDLKLESSNLVKSTLYIDNDNDKDGIGNKSDEDDDNDGLSDVDEIKEGLDPFKADYHVPSSTKDILENSEKHNEQDSGSEEEYKILDEIDNAVMGLLGRFTTNKFDLMIDDISSSQIEKLQKKKESILTSSNNKIDTIVSTSSISLPGQITGISKKEIEEKEIKENILNSGKTFFQKFQLFFISLAIFFLDHQVLLFLLIFLLIYKIIKSIINKILGR